MGEAHPHIFLDLSRLMWRGDRFAPTGIDRVELAYARHLIAAERGRLAFAGWWGRLGLLPAGRAAAFIAALDALWSGGAPDRAARSRAASLARGLRLHALAAGEAPLHARAGSAGAAVYLHVSHQRLDRPAALLRLKAGTGLRFVCFVHDLIPIDHPDLVPRGHPRRHRRRIATVGRLADAAVVNSAGTAAALERHLAEADGRPPLLVAPLGLDLRLPSLLPPESGGRPYFVALSTIEPRKNHALLLEVWRRLAAALGESAPRLVLIGRRGWRAPRILAPLRRPGPLARLVEAHDALPDAAVARLLAGARALLHPSFAEGFGLPVAEALALGVPALCSDLAELRELGRGVPEYLDPRDAALWQAAVLDYAKPASPRRAAQRGRLAHWPAPSWEAHFAAVRPLFD